MDTLHLRMPASAVAPGNIRGKGHSSRRWLIITPEYPPKLGGVADYTREVAIGLTEAGDEVHVLGPAGSDDSGGMPELFVHGVLGCFRIRDIRNTDRTLSRFAAPRQILVQWVPHGYGYRSMNLPFCLWLWKRARCNGDSVDIMVHEPYLAFGEGTWRQNLVAVVHRVMTAILLRAVQKVWVTIPAWEARWRPWTFNRPVPFGCLAVPNNIPVTPDVKAVEDIRRRYELQGTRTHGPVIGHFGTYGTTITSILQKVIPPLLECNQRATLLLIGNGSSNFRERLISASPLLSDRIYATGKLNASEISHHLFACDVMLQPYPDGISGRRTSAIAALAHGIPLVTTLGPLTEAFWADSGAVSLARVQDTGALIEAASGLLRDRAEQIRMKQSGLRLYSNRFHVRHVIGALRTPVV
jgi:glycosyltransferase involved in cell wall biosynthesis